ncbi:adenosylcobinamide-GDP ribazoletransferase [Anaerovibrio sp.]|uniref:adenosylcobinamide-GDP ribazoletransferase n=1 Tax=Anaerovibrio sp. TaxID=1872532 RepID=UPI003F152EEB
MDSFFIGLQFLTRIHVVKQTVWTEEAFGKSVRYFPLVGLTLGLVYAAAAWCLTAAPAFLGWEPPVHVRAAVLAVLPFLLTGGIHCDGFMDTVDGVFSGRERERMLEIMKDSCTGSFAVVSFGILLLLQYAVLLDMPAGVVPTAMLVMPVVGRLMMVVGISLFPYARPEGMGKAFGRYADRKSCLWVTAYTLAILAVAGWQALLSAGAAAIFSCWCGRYVTGLLGGLTGDVYGTLCTVSELIVLMVYLFTYSAFF